jgi:DNA-binding GntR family transcriptional regulator
MNHPKLDRSSISDRVYHAILEQIVNHRIPPGEKLTEEGLSSTLGVSRTPVREALQRLASDGIIEFYPRRGAFAREIIPRDIDELYELRQCLEVHAARQALRNLTGEALREIEPCIEVCRRSQGKAFIEAEIRFDREIHRLINRYCGNGRLRDLLEKLDNLARFMRIVHYNHEELARENFREHEGIWRAMLEGDETRMAHLLETHLENSRRRLLAHFHLNRGNGRERNP